MRSSDCARKSPSCEKLSPIDNCLSQPQAPQHPSSTTTNSFHAWLNSLTARSRKNTFVGSSISLMKQHGSCSVKMTHWSRKSRKNGLRVLGRGQQKERGHNNSSSKGLRSWTVSLPRRKPATNI